MLVRSPLNPSFDQFVDRLLERWHVPGLSIAVMLCISMAILAPRAYRTNPPGPWIGMSS